MTIRAGGNVLVPCYSSGVIYDLLECLYQFIESANLGTTPFYFISPVANSSLEFSQIFAEWWAAPPHTALVQRPPTHRDNQRVILNWTKFFIQA